MAKTMKTPAGADVSAPSGKGSAWTLVLAGGMMAMICAMAITAVSQMAQTIERQSADRRGEFVAEAFVSQPAEAALVENPSAVWGGIIPVAQAVYVPMGDRSGIVCSAQMGASSAWLLETRTRSTNPKLPGSGTSYLSTQDLQGEDVDLFCERARAAL